jgi:hypothetical protein
VASSTISARSNAKGEFDKSLQPSEITSIQRDARQRAPEFASNLENPPTCCIG